MLTVTEQHKHIFLKAVLWQDSNKPTHHLHCHLDLSHMLVDTCMLMFLRSQELAITHILLTAGY